MSSFIATMLATASIYQSNPGSMAEQTGLMSQYLSTYQSDPGSLMGQVGQVELMKRGT